jgi:hypothetical protein
VFTPTAAVFVEVGKSRTLRDSKLAADATAYSIHIHSEKTGLTSASKSIFVCNKMKV